jgi:5-carboxymethyl-2-hydroxymuconate isomerase
VFVPADAVRDPQDLRIHLTVNGVIRQDGSTAMMIHTVAAIISHMSSIFTLEPGDVILTGTPAGVGPLQPGDRVTAEITGVGSLHVTVA